MLPSLDQNRCLANGVAVAKGVIAGGNRNGNSLRRDEFNGNFGCRRDGWSFSIGYGKGSSAREEKRNRSEDSVLHCGCGFDP